MIFVDTGAWLARYVARDQYHSQALAGWKRLEKERLQCCTSNFVLDEFFTLLARRSTYSFAAERARRLYQSTRLTILRPELHDEKVAVELFEKYADQNMSFTDCISFALMKNYKLKLAFSFDRHFIHAGYSLWVKV